MSPLPSYYFTMYIYKYYHGAVKCAHHYHCLSKGIMLSQLRNGNELNGNVFITILYISNEIIKVI